MKHHITTLLNKEMDRKDFLKYMAVAGFMMIGGGAVLRALSGFDNQLSSSEKRSAARGFGGGAYGV